YSICFPTVIAPRYGSSDYAHANDGKKPIPDVNDSVIQSIESPSHHISTELNIDGNPNVSNITLAEQITYLEKGLILVVKSLGLDQPSNDFISELIFVIDRSGSMHGEPVKKASEALQSLLRSLPEDCFFNVVSFGSRDDMPTSVFLLTDGEVYNVDQIVELIKSSEEKKRDDLRVFSIGIGDTVSHHLVELVSRPPIKGYNITWTNQILEDTLLIEINPVDKPTIGFFSDNATPPPDTQTIFKDMKIQQAPFLIPSIYPGARFIIYCILEKGELYNEQEFIHLQLENLFKTLKKEIHLFIRHPRNTRNKGKNISDSFISEQIVKLDVTYSLTSKYTSFLTVDERGSELVAEAKTFNLQRIVPVTGATFALRAPASKFFAMELECDEDGCIEESEDSDVTDLLVASAKLKPPKIETLYSFLNLQSFDGSFLPSDKFYSWFGKNNFKDFESIGIDDEKVLCLALALAYLEIIMFETFKEECEMCYVKAKKILKKEVGGDEQKVNENLEKAKEWVKK
ncbi:hypothetical protein C2G38_2086689, partial [Gigaspora rosea]